LSITTWIPGSSSLFHFQNHSSIILTEIVFATGVRSLFLFFIGVCNFEGKDINLRLKDL
uniref:Ovule protein n=1 Tax=Parascaris equorum TaxID=6256 RepID=A0A914RP27_PAREQ